MRIHPNWWGDVGEDAPEARIERGPSSTFPAAAIPLLPPVLRGITLTSWPGIFLQVQFFNQLQDCPPLARFIFEVTEAVHTFLTYDFSRAMTADDLDEAFKKCVRCHDRVAESGALDGDPGPDDLFAQ
jgi:hypothetical protein